MNVGRRPLVGNKALALKNLMAEITGPVLMGDCDMINYGLATCAICQKAIKALEAAGKDVCFRDVRV